MESQKRIPDGWKQTDTGDKLSYLKVLGLVPWLSPQSDWAHHSALQRGPPPSLSKKRILPLRWNRILFIARATTPPFSVVSRVFRLFQEAMSSTRFANAPASKTLPTSHSHTTTLSEK